MLSGTIILLLLELNSFIEYLQTQAEINAIRNPQPNVPQEDEEDEEGLQAGIFDAVNGAAGPHRDVEPEEFCKDFLSHNYCSLKMGDLLIVGVKGPLSKLFEKALIVLAGFGGFLGSIILVPKCLGKVFFSFVNITDFKRKRKCSFFFVVV